MGGQRPFTPRAGVDEVAPIALAGRLQKSLLALRIAIYSVYNSTSTAAYTYNARGRLTNVQGAGR